jgi:hypothetical protein
MKKEYMALILGVIVASNAEASDIGKALGKADVSRLELIANNMNMLAVIDRIQKGKEKKDQAKNEGIENTYTKFSVSNDHKLIIEDFYSAPVTDVTNTICGEQLAKLADNVSGTNKMGVALSMLSPTSLSSEQAQQLLNDSYLVVYMQAKENSQLSLSCKK